MKLLAIVLTFLSAMGFGYFFFLASSAEKKEGVACLTAGPLPSFGFTLEGFPLFEKEIEKLKIDPAIPFTAIQFYLQWSSPLAPLKQTLETIKRQGAVPCMTWEPMIIEGNAKKTILSEEILAGKWDDYLEKVATLLADWNDTVIIRLAHEMNLKKYHWGVSADQYVDSAPKHYIELFRYIVHFFKQRGLFHLWWAFCPNAESVPKKAWNEVIHYYPGNDVVDILGMDGYNFEITEKTAQQRGLKWTRPWLSFEALFFPLYSDLKKIAPEKPIMVFETSSTGNSETKAKWAFEALETAKKWNLLAILWFQVNKEENWLLQESQTKALSFLRRALNPLDHFLKSDRKDTPISPPHSTLSTDASSP